MRHRSAMRAQIYVPKRIIPRNTAPPVPFLAPIRPATAGRALTRRPFADKLKQVNCDHNNTPFATRCWKKAKSWRNGHKMGPSGATRQQGLTDGVGGRGPAHNTRVQPLVCAVSPANTLATPIPLRLTADAIMQDLHRANRLCLFPLAGMPKPLPLCSGCGSGCGSGSGSGSGSGASLPNILSKGCL